LRKQSNIIEANLNDRMKQVEHMLSEKIQVIEMEVSNRATPITMHVKATHYSIIENICCAGNIIEITLTAQLENTTFHIAHLRMLINTFSSRFATPPIPYPIQD